LRFNSRKKGYWEIKGGDIKIQIKSIQKLYLNKVEDNKIYIGISGIFKSRNKINCYYYIQAERKDIDKLEKIRKNNT